MLFAFQLSKAAYIVAGREMSIVLSALIGSLWMDEGDLRHRLAAALVVAAGVACVASRAEAPTRLKTAARGLLKP